jgi:hypothetical protein
MSSSFPDSFIFGEVLLFPGPAGGHVAAGLWIEMPDLQTASFPQRNQAQDVIALILRLLPEGWTLQVIQFQDSGDGTRLLEYQQQTEACRNPAARLLRNANFVSLWQQRERREMRRTRVAIYFGRPLNTAPDSWWRQPSEREYEQMLAEARTAFADWTQTVQQALEPIGGRAWALTEADHARLWANALNPSFSERLTYDPAAHFDPERSLLENCWHSELRGLGRQGFVLDGWQHLALTLKRLPAETYPTIIHRLVKLPFGDFTTTVHVRRLSKEVVLKRLRPALDRIHQQLSRKPDERLAVARAQMDDKVRRLASGEGVPLEIEFIVIVRAPTPDALAAKAAPIKSALASMNGAQCYEATLPATSRQLFTKTLPGWMWSRHSGIRHYAEERVTADLLPWCGSFGGHPGPTDCLFPGANANLVNVVNFLGEGSGLTPQNLVIVGATGTGKSLALRKLLMETSA